MKRIVTSIVIALAVVFCLTLPTLAGSSINMVVNGKKITSNDAPPFIDENGRTQVPVRFVSEALGAKVDWETSTRTVTVTYKSNIIKFVIGVKEYVSSTGKNKMDTSPVIRNGRTFVPIRYVGEALGAKVDWNSETSTVTIREKELPKRVVIFAGKRTINVDNDVYIVGKDNPAELPELIKNYLLIPIKNIADIFNGTYSYDSKTNIAKLSIDNTLFEFKVYEAGAKVNGKEVKLPAETRIDNQVVKVPAIAFVGNLERYDVIQFKNNSILFREKGKTDLYDSEGKLISTFDKEYIDKSWEERLNSFDKDIVKLVNDKVTKIIAEITEPGMTDYEKVLAVNRYLIDNVEYDNTLKSNVFDAFVTGKSVCEGFAHAAGLILSRMGIENKYVVGYAGVNGYGDIDEYEIYNYSSNAHAWNMVKLDGKYYHLDTTFNAASLNGEKSNHNAYSYFLLSDEQIMSDHIWRKSLYPKCSSFEYSEELLENLKNKGYTIFSGKVRLKDNSTAKEDIHVLMGMYSKPSGRLSSSKIIILDKDKSETTFTFVPERDFNENNFYIGFQSPSSDVYQTKEPFTVTTNTSDGFYYEAVINNTDLAEVKGKILLPEPAKIDQSIFIKVSTMVPSGTGYSVHAALGSRIEIRKGKLEEAFQFKVPIPQSDFWYDVEVISGNYSYYVNETGELSLESNVINNKNFPINNLNIKLTKDMLEQPEAETDAGVDLNSYQLEELKEKIKECHIGNKAKLLKIKKPEDSKSIEQSVPVEIDSNGTLYYSDRLSSGVQVWRSYSVGYNKKSIRYSISLNDIKITEENYMNLFNTLNVYMKDLIGAKELSIPYVYVENEGKKSISLMDSKELYIKIIKGYAQIISDYNQGDLKYELNMSGYASDETCHMSIYVNIPIS